MEKKTYKPKDDAEGLSITVQVGGDADGHTLEVGEWPYSTEDGREQRILDAHPLVTDGSEAQEKRGGLAKPAKAPEETQKKENG